jgi:hypothetical protein
VDVVSDSRVVEELTAYAPLSDFCLVEGLIYFRNFQGYWMSLILEEDDLWLAAKDYLHRVGAPVFESGEDWSEWVHRTSRCT